MAGFFLTNEITTSDSIQYALSQVQDGGTLTLRGGTYTEYVRVQNPVTIQAYEGETVIIQAPTGSQSANMAIEASNVTLKDITIDATNRHRGIDVLSGSDNFTMDGCTIQNCVGDTSGKYGQGVIVSDCDTATFRNCTFDTIGGVEGDETFCHAIYTSIPNLLVELCDFNNIDGNGVNVYGSNDATFIIRQNGFTNCGGGAGLYRGTGIVHDNTIDGGGAGYGVIANFNPTDVEIYNNTISNMFIGLTASNYGVIVDSIYFHDNTVSLSDIGIHCEHTGTLDEGQGVVFEANQLISCDTAIQLVGDAATEVTLIDNEVS